IDLDVERNVLTVRAERTRLDEDREFVSAERPRGVFTRRLFLGENLDTDRIEARYRNGVLRLTIPVAEKAKPKKIAVLDAESDKAIDAVLDPALADEDDKKTGERREAELVT